MMADVNSSSSSKPDGRVVDISHDDHDEEDSLEARHHKIFQGMQNFYSKDQNLFRGLADPTRESQPVRSAADVNAIFYSPQYWGQSEDVLTRRCDQCGEVGNLACFSPSFRRWLLKRNVEKERNHRCCRCGEMGHNCLSCPLPITFKWPQPSTLTGPQPSNPIADPPKLAQARVIQRRKAPRCSRCGKLGHNCRSCRMPIE